MGRMAGMFLGLICGGMALFHGLASILKFKSGILKLPRIYFFWLIFGLVLGLGNLLLNIDITSELLFPLFFLLGAALPTLGVLTWLGHRLGWPLTKRQAWLALVSGSTLSIWVTITLGTLITYIIYLLVYPLEFLAYSFTDLLTFSGPDFLERLFFSPVILVFLFITALEAPFPEEFAKALAVPIFGRRRITSERQAFMIGVFSGAGFAILENMLYEGLYAQWFGWTWGGVTLLRGIGSVLHPLGTGIIALGWYRMREGGWGKLFKAYLLAVGLHTLWNGGFQPFVYLTGLENYGGLSPTISLYGEALEFLLVAYLVGLSAGLWWIMWRITADLAKETKPELFPLAISPRRVAVWAFICALVLIPIGAALGPAWPEIKALILEGIVR